MNSENILNKLCLGTAQFGQKYGIANTRGQIAEHEVFEILDLADQMGIRLLDTAGSYLESERIIGRYTNSRQAPFNVISKWLGHQSGGAGIFDEVSASLEKLCMKTLYAYLVHHFDQFLNDTKIWDEFKKIKNKGLSRKIGFSLYRPDELDYLLENNIDFDIVEVPFSVVDQRFGSYFAVLKERNVEVLVRSVFLQGLVFLSEQQIPLNLQEAKEPMRKVRNFARYNSLTLHSLCLNFVLHNPLIDKVIVGIDGIDQLQANIEAVKDFSRVGLLSHEIKNLQMTDEKILIPSQWN